LVLLVKKTTLYKERNEKKREEFFLEVDSIEISNRVYLDESGIDNNNYRKYARSFKGKRAFGDIIGGKKERYSIIAALCEKNIKAPFVFKGNTNTETFNKWLESSLIPELKTGQTVIMDNASFHKSEKTRNLIEGAGCRLLYLPPYSPDFNPIENYWAITKKRLRSKKFKYKNLISNIYAALKLNVNTLP